MMEQSSIQINQYSVGEEIANSITHGLGILLSIAGLIVLVVTASFHGDPWEIVSVSIFGSTLIILYLASTLYHSLSNPSLKLGLKTFDHSAIFLLIAGTYTPFLLVHLRDAFGWSLFGVIWGLAITGIIIKVFFAQKFKKLSLGIYLFMGWLCLFALRGLMLNLPPQSMTLLVIGGILYTMGTVFYAWKKLTFNHAIWHVFVLGGSIAHYFSVLKSL